MQSINFFKEDINIDLRSLRKLKKWIIHVAAKHDQEVDSINYIFCSDEYLHHMNQEYLSHDTLTDIITFDLRENQATEPIEADIFISVDRVRDNASSLNTEFKQELSRVIIHGVLHLIGFKDKTKEQKELMRSEEAKALELLN